MLELVFCQVQTSPVAPLGGPIDSRSVSLATMVVLGLLGLAAFGLIYYRKRRLQNTVEAQFKDFRKRAVALMDQLDGLRQRHKTLPTDPDFTVAMSGDTLALYNEVSRDLDSLWEALAQGHGDLGAGESRIAKVPAWGSSRRKRPESCSEEEKSMSSSDSPTRAGSGLTA